MSSIEFVVLTPLLFVLLFTVVQFAMYFFAAQVTEAAAQAGARKARATADRDGGWSAEAHDTTLNRIRSLGPALVGNPQIQVGRNGDQVTVAVNADVVPVVPGLNLHVTSTSSGPVERFIPDAG